MKKKIIILVIILFFISIIPIPSTLQDGGSVEYTAILYKITKLHQLRKVSDWEEKGMYITGTTIEILGMEIYNNTN